MEVDWQNVGEYIATILSVVIPVILLKLKGKNEILRILIESIQQKEGKGGLIRTEIKKRANSVNMNDKVKKEVKRKLDKMK